MEFSVKAYLQRADSAVEVRRIPVTLEGNSNIYQQMLARVSQSFPGLKEKLVTLKWRDSDGDYVLMSSDEELTEALSQSAGTPLKIYITIDADRQDMPAEADNGSEQHSHNKELPEDAQEELMGFPFIPPPPPPPQTSFCGPEPPCGKKRRHHGPFGGHWLFEGRFPFGGQGHFSYGPFGGEGHCGFGPSGGHGPFGGHGSFHGHGPFGRGGPFGHGHFGGLAHGPYGFFHHERHHGFGKDHKRRFNNDSGWKGKLRDAVPVAHRRWAKYYIRNWRVANLKNATTTSSESDQENVTMEAANVPEAYAKWLDHILVKWHRRWNQFTEGENSASKSSSDQKSENKKQLKASVPKEFRKWTKWYLARHFGQKEAPIFKEDFQHVRGHCIGKGKKHGGIGKKMWKKAYKMHFLDSSVPLKYRIWARQFISDWRQQNKLSDGVSSSSASESDDMDMAKPQGISVPNDYSKWLILFLNKWHINRGLLQGQKSCKFEMEEIKDKVPWDFRKWVKCYLWRRYMKNAGEKGSSRQYQKWMEAFQKKWQSEQSLVGDGLNLTSSDDEAGTATSGKTSEVEKSFKKLRLDEQTCAQNVSFAEDQRVDKEQTLESAQNKMNWAKEGGCDGKTPSATSAGASDEEIPPQMYHWMTKMMMKMQMKKMKKDFKDARKEKKAAAKAQRYFRM